MARTNVKNKAAAPAADKSEADQFVLTKEGRKPWTTTSREEVTNLRARGWKLEEAPASTDAGQAGGQSED